MKASDFEKARLLLKSINNIDEIFRPYDDEEGGETTISILQGISLSLLDNGANTAVLVLTDEGETDFDATITADGWDRIKVILIEELRAQRDIRVKLLADLGVTLDEPEPVANQPKETV